MERHDGKTKTNALENRREREVLRYAELLGSPWRHHLTDGLKSSKDSALTAYAQLVALRLNGKRVLISLIGSKQQYVLTEATQTLSLQNDTMHEPDDGIKFGVTVMPLESSLCRRSLPSNLPGALGRCGRDIIIPDLRLDAVCAQHPSVVGEPFTRSFVAVPLLAESGIAIGTITMLDDKPRYDLSEVDLVFMREISATVVAHLDMRCANYAHERALRMVRSLGQLTENKDDPDGKEGNVSSFERSTPSLPTDDETALPSRTGEDTTYISNETLQQTLESNEFGNTFSGENHQDFPRSRGSSPNLTLLSSRRTPLAEDESSVKIPSSLPHPLLHKNSTEDVQEALLSSGVRQTFERAASILQKGMDVTGVAFLDASVGRSTTDNTAAWNRVTRTGSESSRKTSDTLQDSGSENSAASRGSRGTGHTLTKRLKTCRMLGLTTNNEPNEIQRQDHPLKTITESFVGSLLKRYPNGKVWNFNDHGCISSDSKSDYSSADGIRKENFEHNSDGEGTGVDDHRRPRTTSAKIQQLFPGVRSVALIPLWDSHRERNFAASFVWSCESFRVLSFKDDVPFLAAFGDIMMAEVGRLDAQTESRTKTRFISTVSHELRSPLHGIIGATEILQNKDNVALHEEMLHMIQGCSRTLMDIIDHLLDHAQTLVDSPVLSQDEPKDSSQRVLDPYSSHTFGQEATEECCDIASIAQEVMDASLWSMPTATAKSVSGNAHVSVSTASTEPLKAALEVIPNDPEDNWNFHISAGAWRRVVQNLVSNSIKYTDPGGYLKITLSCQKLPAKQTHLGKELIRLECTDNGRGIGQEYLISGLWKAFSQEDGHTQGTGLGLSLVHDIVEGLGGSVDAESTKGVGTKVTVLLPLIHAKQRQSSSALEATVQSRQALRGMTMALLGFDTADTHNHRSVESMQVLRTSVAKTCQNLGLDCVERLNAADFYLITEEAAMLTSGLIKQLASQNLMTKVLVLCYTAASAQRVTMSTTSQLSDATFVSQPLGPQKLQTCLETSLSKRKDNTKTLDEARSSPEPPAITNDAGSPPPRPLQETPEMVLRRSYSADSQKWSVATPGSFSVLLVEDNEINLRLLQTYMKKCGHYQISAQNGLEALNAYQAAFRIANEALLLGGAANQPPTIILMDINMPVMDGFESTRRIRACEQSLGIQPSLIVALTALSSHDARQKAHASGVDHFLTKPVKLHELRHVLDLRRPTNSHSKEKTTTSC